MKPFKVSIILPAHNEERRIGKTLDRFYNILPHKLEGGFEIIVILNNCIDKTLEVLKNYSKRYPDLRFKNFDFALGKGGAIIQGFKIATGEYVSFIDADGSTGPFDFLKVMRGISGYDGAIASRWAASSKKIDLPFSRKLISRGFNLLVRIFFQFPYRDTQCGAKIFRKAIIDTVINDLGVSGFAFDVELLYLLYKKGFRINEVPIRWKHYGKSTLNMRKAIPLMFLAVVRLRLMESPFRFIVIRALRELGKIHH